jgi:hypothetical protein
MRSSENSKRTTGGRAAKEHEVTTYRWAAEKEFTVIQNIPAVSVQDTTPVPGTDIDLRDYPGARVMFICTVSSYSAHGITFALQDAEAGIVDPTIPSVIGGAAYTAVPAARYSGSQAKISKEDVTVVSLLTHKDRPFVRVVATGDSADTDLVAGVTALLFYVP